MTIDSWADYLEHCPEKYYFVLNRIQENFKSFSDFQKTINTKCSFASSVKSFSDNEWQMLGDWLDDFFMPDQHPPFY